MKKLTTVVATLALALPLTATPFVGATSARAATATPKTTHPLDKVSHFRATSVHVQHTTTLTTIQFAADRASATTTPAKTKIAPKTTYTATKTIILTTGKHATTAYTLISKHGKVLGWVKTVDLTKPVTHPKATTKPTPKRNAKAAKHATNKRTPARKVAPTAKKISLVAKHPKTSIKATTKATHPKANKTVTKATKRAPKLTIKPASSTKAAEKAIQKATKKVTRKTTKKANRQAAKNITKKVTKKVAPEVASKVTSKATKKAAPKATKKVTKLAAKKHSPLKPTAAHPTHKTSIKASAKL
ncbi:hypothetical protein [Lactiplantibacillus pentosus]|jgi:hypothetical protein|uniref:hypothetical protein n=1 Tax=Lactiplantibacillus pentosus TaxID=1589 RepID=UPI003D7ACFBB